MKKERKKGVAIALSLAIFLVLLIQFISADIIFNQQPNSVYNLGENILLPVTVKPVNSFSGTFQMSLLCNGTATNFFTYPLTLASGEEVSFESPKPSLVLIKELIGNEIGICKIKAFLGTDYSLSNEFEISDVLNVESTITKTSFNPGESIDIKGKVTKKSGGGSSGFVEIKIISSENNVSQQASITDGSFSMNFALPGNLKAGNYVFQIEATEKDTSGSITNKGKAEKAFSVNQVPTNLELIIENKSIAPATWFGFNAVLHDQTGISIPSLVVVTIKDANNKIMEQKEIQTEELFEYYVKPDQAPATWKIFAVSNKLTSESSFVIEAKESIDIEIVNKTITIKNDGNVPYNKTILIKVGDSPVNLEVKLEVGESKKYTVNAPDGEYDVTVNNGLTELMKRVSLTGKTVEVREAGIVSLAMVGWVALIAVLTVSFIFVFRRTYQKPFFLKTLLTRGNRNEKNHFKELSAESDSVVAKSGEKAEMSLSIKGDKQDASIVCLKIKNLNEVTSKRGSVSETLDKIKYLAEGQKASLYENQDYLFFIFAPARTKTFKNEKNALDVADKMHNLLMEHNRSFNQKIDFGISLNSGAIIAKAEPDSFKFMSLGTLITTAKKIATLSNNEVLLSHEMNDLLRLIVKTEKQMRNDTPVYSITRIKRENEEARKFIDKFMHRQQKE